MTRMKNDGILVEFYFVTLVTNALIFWETILCFAFLWLKLIYTSHIGLGPLMPAFLRSIEWFVKSL